MKLKLLSLLIFILLFNILQTITMAQKIRPVRDDVGFSWYPDEMNQLMSYLNRYNKNVENFPADNLVAAISPHDDYLYAGNVYYPLYKLIRTKEVVTASRALLLARVSWRSNSNCTYR